MVMTRGRRIVHNDIVVLSDPAILVYYYSII